MSQNTCAESSVKRPKLKKMDMRITMWNVRSLKEILERQKGMVWTGLIWLSIGTSGGLL
jgi:hypothetical protein